MNLFLASINNDFPFRVITLQKTHISADSDINLYDIPDNTSVYDPAHINSFGGVIFIQKLGHEKFKQNSGDNIKKYVVSVCRRISDLVAAISQVQLGQKYKVQLNYMAQPTPHPVL